VFHGTSTEEGYKVSGKTVRGKKLHTESRGKCYSWYQTI